MDFLNKISSLMITGGTGSFGEKMLLTLLKKTKIPRIIIFSRDEQKQFSIKETLSKKDLSRVRFFIGDIRDSSRLDFAMREVEVVIHAAAMKIVMTAEYDPFECVKTNIIGAENVVNACINNNIKKVIALSTDKACNPVNLYGATKLVSDKIFIAANNVVGKRKTKFAVVRYGNVLGSRGSVLLKFIEHIKEGKKFLPVTDNKMTRFMITLQQGVNFVMLSLNDIIGGEVFVPKIPSMNILDLAKAVGDKQKIKVTGIRPGEKLHEVLISKDDSRNTIEFKNHFIIKPEILIREYRNSNYKSRYKKVKTNFEYSSDKNSEWLNIIQLKSLISRSGYTI